MQNLGSIGADTQLALARAQAGNKQMAEHAGALQQARRTGNMDMQAIEKAAQDFEAVFLTQMLKPMFEGIEVDKTFGGGRGEEVFRGFMLQEYGKKMAENGGIGIAEQVKAELIEIQQSQTRGGENNGRVR